MEYYLLERTIRRQVESRCRCYNQRLEKYSKTAIIEPEYERVCLIVRIIKYSQNLFAGWKNRNR